jgi:hypothetical protein
MTRAPTAIVVYGALLLLLLLCAAGCGGAGRNVPAAYVACGDHQGPRARAICQAVWQDMEFGWQSGSGGSVGYAVTPRTIKKVFCRLRIGKDDVPALEGLVAPREQARVRQAARDLLQLLRVEPYRRQAGVYHVDDPRYVLKTRCSRTF